MKNREKDMKAEGKPVESKTPDLDSSYKSSIPDFDELTERFERMKAKDEIKKDKNYKEPYAFESDETSLLEQSMVPPEYESIESEINFTESKQNQVLEDRANFHRPLTQFYGDAAVIGCGNKSKVGFDLFSQTIKHSMHHNMDYFYSFDLDETENPDCQADIGRDHGYPPKGSVSRFNFIFLENLTNVAYLNDNYQFDNPILQSMLAQNGVMLIIGIPPSGMYKPLPGQLYFDNHHSGAKPGALIITGWSHVSPLLIVQGLNTGAQNLIKLYHPEIYFRKETQYDLNANSNYMKKHAIIMLEREVARLLADKKNAKFELLNKVTGKEVTIFALHALIEAIAQWDTSEDKNLSEVISDTAKDHPILTRSLFNDTVSQVLNVIKGMDNYHQAQKSNFKPKNYQT